MALSRTELSKLLSGVDNQEDIINYVMAENGKQVNQLRAENENLKTQLSDANDKLAAKDKEYVALKDSVKDFDNFKQENENLKAQVKSFEDSKKNEAYMSELAKAGVDDKFKKFIFSEIKPNENEKAEEYKARVAEYLEQNQQFKSENYGKIDTQFDFKNGKEVDFSKMTDEQYLRYRAEQRKK